MLSSPTVAGAAVRSTSIDLDQVTVKFPTPGGTIHTAVEDLDLQVPAGQFCAVVGPTGCGKSTTLTLIAGLEQPTGGRGRVHGRAVRGIGQDIGFVFQTDAL